MNQEVVFRPEELFYLGKQMDGLYYNYDYYSAIPAVEQADGKKMLWRCESTLAERGVLTENDEGDMAPNEEISDLLRPIFFGAHQAKVTYQPDAGKNEAAVFYFHWLEDACRMVRQTNEGFGICAVEDNDLIAFLAALLPENYHEKTIAPETQAPETDKITQMILIGGNTVEGTAYEMTAAVADELVCMVEDEKLRVMSADEFIAAALQVMKEEA